MSALHDRHVYAWTEEQARLLRRCPSLRRRLDEFLADAREIALPRIAPRLPMLPDDSPLPGTRPCTADRVLDPDRFPGPPSATA